MDIVKRIKLDFVIEAVVMIVVGIVLAVWTEVSLDIMARVLAILLILVGGIFIISYFIHKERNLASSGGLGVGIVIAAIGCWIFINPGTFTDFIPKLFGLFIIVSGINNLVQTISLIRYKSKTWIASLIITIITFALGAFLLFNPTDAKEIAVTLIGAFLIIDGVTNLITSILVGVATKRVEQEKNAIDAEAVVIEEDK